MHQVIELIYLIQTKETVRDSAILIKGFVNYHEMTCLDDECSLKIYKRHHLNKPMGFAIQGSRNAESANG